MGGGLFGLSDWEGFWVGTIFGIGKWLGLRSVDLCSFWICGLIWKMD